MGYEIERKFLIKEGSRPELDNGIPIIQAYLSADPMRIVRIRSTGERAFLTIKSGTDPGRLTRGEWEYEISPDDFEALLKIALPGRIEKTRFLVPHGKRTIEVDVFHGKNEGLIIAEVELESETELFDPPVWIGEEVTGDPAYYNVNLVK